MRNIEHVEVDGSKPVVPVKITNCGEFNASKDHGAVVLENGNTLSLDLMVR